MSNHAAESCSAGSNGFSRTQWGTLAAVWSIYGTCYFCRVNGGAANPVITQTLLSAEQMGLVLGSFKIAYAIGQLVNGQLAERIGAKSILWVGLIGAVAANIGFGFSVGLWSMFVAWSLNGFFQAGLWPPCVKMTANWFAPWQRGRAMGVLGTSYQLCSALALSVMGYLIVSSGNNWRVAFFVPAAVFLLVGVPSAWWLRERPDAGDALASGANSKLEPAQPALSFWHIVELTLANPRVWVLGLGLAGLNVARFGYVEWSSKHLLEVQGSALSKATLQIAVLPLGGVVGVLAAGWISDRLFQSRRAPVIAIMLASLGLLTLVYDWTVTSGGWLATVVCLSAIGFFIFGPQVMLVGTAPADLARRDTAAAAAGFVDALAYVGAAGGSWLTGRLVQHYGWHAAVFLWAGASFAAAALAACLWNARAAAPDST